MVASLANQINRAGNQQQVIGINNIQGVFYTIPNTFHNVNLNTGRDLSRANDRVEMWLALRARELIA